MTHADLLAGHDVMDRLARCLLDVTRDRVSQADTACIMLRRLAIQVRDHLAREDPMIRAIAAAAGGTRHGPIADLSIEDFVAFSDLWSLYVYRWDRPHVARDWTLFGDETDVVVGQLLGRILREATILYPLALHHGVIAAGR